MNISCCRRRHWRFVDGAVQPIRAWVDAWSRKLLYQPPDQAEVWVDKPPPQHPASSYRCADPAKARRHGVSEVNIFRHASRKGYGPRRDREMSPRSIRCHRLQQWNVMEKRCHGRSSYHLQRTEYRCRRARDTNFFARPVALHMARACREVPEVEVEPL